MELRLAEDQGFNPDQESKHLASLWNREFYKNIVAGIDDDDCGIVKVGKEQIVVTTDYLNANPIAVELGLGTLKDLGRILVAANISDLCGTGAVPIGFLASIMLNKSSAGNNLRFKEIMAGIALELQRYSIPLIGGDTKLGNGDSFCATAIGKKNKNGSLFIKNRAKNGDSIWVSGKIGSMAAAIYGLGNGHTNENWHNWAKKTILQTNVPLKKSMAISQSKIITAGTDLSDGLGANLFSLCESSGVGAKINVESIPVSKQVKEIAIKLKIDPWKFAMTIGGDFQFIVTAKKSINLEKFKMFNIGSIIEKDQYKIQRNGILQPFQFGGHSDHNITNFKTEVIDLIEKLK